MGNRVWASVTALAYGALVLTWGAAGPGAARESPDDDVFALTTIHEFHLEFTAKEWERMQPVGGFRFPGFPGGPGAPARPEQPPAKPGEEPPETHRSAFGMEFPYAHASLTAGGKTYKDLGARYKGNGSYMPSMGKLKRNLKLELDHYDEAQHFRGQKSLNLNSGAADPTRMHEALAYAVFRGAGVPTPRTALAEVTLTVAGKYDKEYLGLYTLVEQVDRTFLKDRFQTGKGLLLKPEGVRGLDYLGEDWERYRARYKPKRDPSKQEARRLIDFARLVHRADDEQFRKEIGSYLDVEEFLRFFAANTLVANMDSFFTIGHNYYLYLHPETNKFLFLPWDLDLSFAGFPMMGSPDQQTDLSLTRPYAGEHKLADRLFAMKEVSERYEKIVRELAATCFAKEKLLADIDALDKATKEIVAREKRATEARKEGAGFGFGPGGMFARTPDVRTFVAKRTESVASQLAGKSKGFVPTTGFGFGGGPGGAGMGSRLAKPLLQALDADKDDKVTREELVAGATQFFKDCDKDKKGALDAKQFADGFNRVLPPRPGFGNPPAGGPPGGGQGTFYAGPVVRRSDADKDGKVTLDEFVAAAEALFKEADKDKKGALDEKQLGAAFALLFPPPPGFGPPPADRPREDKKDGPNGAPEGRRNVVPGEGNEQASPGFEPRRGVGG